ncbi:unnamed protein product [Menidia menidia]|uniref:(Atlantic silverside) hypothetical protein n=1 Tax=Menidia menidia TaxID=238744 RepID=A0A8S4BKJ1_9TELE|nr:unnamed protein product [Menidia menidia]
MWLALLTYQLASLFTVRAQNACLGHPTFRAPANTDIEVFCGSQTVDLQILLCPVYFSGYNESLLALNSEHSLNRCRGTADWTVDPPVARFNVSITDEGIAACSSSLTVSQETGTGVFADFSLVQYINISGMVCSEDPEGGTITYRRDVMYRFSCRYPLQYLVNNTQISVCDRDGQTVLGTNGEQQEARFSFEAFRFVQSAAGSFSTYYIHCATRLCVNTICPTLTQNCTTNSRRRRSVTEEGETKVTDAATVSSGPITVHLDRGYLVTSGGLEQGDVTVVAVSMVAGVSGAVCLILGAFVFYQKYKSKSASKKMNWFTQE